MLLEEAKKIEKINNNFVPSDGHTSPIKSIPWFSCVNLSPSDF